ncbi:MAG: asparagine synthase (glutamine-hydrolyzing), partial [Thermoguttaceae bacterium]
KSILEVPGVARNLDPISLDLYLTYQYVPHPRTIFEGISKLSPGNFAKYSVSSGEFQVESYWNCDFNEETRHKSFESWSQELRELLTSAVKMRMRSDVPLGAFLSGGIDSTIITGLMQQFSGQKVKTFSIGFPQKEYDETSYARLAAEKFGTEHEQFFVTPDAKEVLPKLVWHYDEPFSDSSAIPTYYLSQLTRKHVTVTLSGDGGDELFAGYERYLAVKWGKWADLLPLCIRKILSGPIMRMIPASIHQKSPLRRGKRFLEALGMPPMERYLQWIAIFNRSRKHELYSKEFAQQLAAVSAKQSGGVYDMLNFLLEAEAKSNKRDEITSISLTDLITYLPCDLMNKVDIASMSVGLETRAPFLDYRVAELAVRMPINCKVRGRIGKYILRETFRELFPPELLSRPKMGFGVPLDHWFRGPLAGFVKEILLDHRCTKRGYFNSEYVAKIINQHQAGQFDHAGRIYSLLFLELWMREWIDR